MRPLDVQSIYTNMAKCDLSSRTIRYTHAIRTCALKQAVRWNLLARNPCEGVEPPRLERKETQALSPDRESHTNVGLAKRRWLVFWGAEDNAQPSSCNLSRTYSENLKGIPIKPS